MYGVEAAGKGLETSMHAASLSKGSRQVCFMVIKLTYYRMMMVRLLKGHSISAGLDYPGIGPEHSWLKDEDRVKYVSATDSEALEAFQICSRYEGIIPALEPSHALSFVIKLAKED